MRYWGCAFTVGQFSVHRKPVTHCLLLLTVLTFGQLQQTLLQTESIPGPVASATFGAGTPAPYGTATLYSDEYWSQQFSRLLQAPGLNDTLLQPCSADAPLINSSAAVSAACVGNLANYSLSLDVDTTTGCLTEQNANYNGTLVSTPSNLKVVDSAAACCNLCAQVLGQDLPFPCNTWVWCGNPSGCCGLASGCGQDAEGLSHMLPYGVCTLKYQYQAQLDQAYKSLTPEYWYQSADVENWPGWSNGTASSMCKGLTSGVYTTYLRNATNPAPQAEGYTLLPGRDLQAGNYGCAGSQDNDSATYCRDYGTLQEVSQRCRTDPQCNAFVYEEEGCCDQNRSTAFRKHYAFPTVAQQCSVALPFARLYQDSSITAATQNANGGAHSGGSNTGAIAGGVAGGVVGLGILLALPFAFALRRKRKTGAWPAWVPRKRPGSAPSRANYRPAAPNSRAVSSNAALSGSVWAPQIEDSDNMTALRVNLRDSSATENGHSPSSNRKLYTPPDSKGSAKGLHPASKGILKGDRPNSRTNLRGGVPDSAHSAITVGPQTGSPRSIEMAFSTSGSESPDTEGKNAGTRLLDNMRATSRVGAFEEWEIDPDDLQIEKTADGRDLQLGAGGFGMVFKGLRHGVDQVAIKVLKGQQDERMQQAFIKEIDLLRRARHPNIVQYLGAVVHDQRIMLVTEFMSGGDLWTALSRNGNQYNWHDRGKRVALDIAQALNYLHSNSTVHFDLKSGNCLLSRDGTAKLCDVGLARILKSSHYTRVGMEATWSWAAPEVILGQQCTTKADVFSFGVVLWEICTGEIPVRGQMRPVSVPDECPRDIKDLMWECTDGSPHKRPDMRTVVNTLRKHQ